MSEYRIISQAISSLLAVRPDGSAVVELTNGKKVRLTAEALAVVNINVYLSPQMLVIPTVAARISWLRDKLIGVHVTLRRNGSQLEVTGFHDRPVEVLYITEADRDDLSKAAAFGARFTHAQQVIFNTLKRAKNPRLVGFYKDVIAQFKTHRKDEHTLSNVGECFPTAA